MGKTPHVHSKFFCEDGSHEFNLPTHAQLDAASRFYDVVLHIQIAVDRNLYRHRQFGFIQLDIG